ncbi:hypothetical protein FTUN_5284 [Frigoriglobus tundricola]|uniref:Uncharacterized protein n=1 Tax=Frigoriglobus tundricola TaxID=2774151 RepID=A0A6M5YUE2_9BACT|nr:hypothetical protein FTUN_5284 [Frigoriglobus tundricola]
MSQFLLSDAGRSSEFPNPNEKVRIRVRASGFAPDRVITRPARHKC